MGMVNVVLNAVMHIYLRHTDFNVLQTEHLLSPAVAPKEVLAQFPPTAILTGDVDPLLDDSIYFFHRLSNY